MSAGKDERTSIRAWYICFAVPSKNFPHPPTNSVSPGRGGRRRIEEEEEEED